MARHRNLNKTPQTPNTNPNTHTNNVVNYIPTTPTTPKTTTTNNNKTPSPPSLSPLRISPPSPRRNTTPPCLTPTPTQRFLVILILILPYFLYTRPVPTLRLIYFCLWYLLVGLVGHVVFCIAWWETYREAADIAAWERGYKGRVREMVVARWGAEWELLIRSGADGEDWVEEEVLN
ncbi:hypothetical protein DM02DRAFT_701867 [Periconia macrospinosa]|uniref:Uncharacterized protein n=1 Tax=Periconia macrospinosa TaxID=97972 RepID=A0A2V1DVM4_9PLEO|nr:hypothetical protein DM02DRAFT_701867 [Periconia macrospinosa]